MRFWNVRDSARTFSPASCRFIHQPTPPAGIVGLMSMLTSSSRVSPSVMIWWHGEVSVVPQVALYWVFCTCENTLKSRRL